MLFVIIAASFVFFVAQKSLFWWRYWYYDIVKKALLVTYFNIVCYNFTKQGYSCCNIAEATLLVLVLKQYYSSHNVTDSTCSGLKMIGSMLFVSENCQSSTILLEYHWSKVIFYNVVLAICASMMLVNLTLRYSCGCYLVWGSLSNVGLPHRIVEIMVMSDTRLLMLRYFHYLVRTLHRSLVSLVLPIINDVLLQNLYIIVLVYLSPQVKA